MIDALFNSVSSNSFMPHGYCFSWTPSLLWTYVLSDSLIAASYFSIPVALWYMVQKRRDLPVPSMFWLFGAFVLACGMTHLFALWNIWHANYWADAGLKALTAAVSVVTAIMLWVVMPKILSIPTHAQLESANRGLQGEIARRKQAEADLRLAHGDLERRVAERTAELETANNALRRSEARYRAFAQSAKAAIVTADGAGKIVDWNKAAEVIFGYSEAEAKGRPVTLLMPGAYHDRHLAGMARVAAGGETDMIGKNVELIGTRKDKSEFPLDLSLAKWETSEGQFFTGIIHDITERKRADEAVRDSEEGLRSIFEGALDGILVADVGNRRFLAGNAAICNMLGYTREEIVRLGVSDIHPKQDLPRAIENFERLMRGEIELAADVPMLHSDGTVAYADVKASPIRLGGKDCLLGVFRDNTERKQIERTVARQRDLYDVLSQTNQMIVRGASRDLLFQGICRIAVEHGRFLFAWIGLIDPASKRLEPVARYGEDAGYVAQLDISVDESVPSGRNRTASALRAGTRLILNDFADESVQPVSRNIEAAQRAGVRAYGTFPIREGGVVAGVINFYAAEAGFFTDDLVVTLEEMAQDVSFALDNMDRETARRQAEQALRESEARFRSLTNLSSDWFWEQDAEFRAIGFSDSETRQSGAATRPGLGARRWDVPALNLSDADWAHHRAALERHETFRDFEIERANAQGGTTWISLSGEPVFGPDGEFRGYRGVGRNITERKHAEAELARLAAIVEGSSDVIMSRGTDRRVMTWNAAAERMFGYSAEEVIGTDFEYLVPIEDRAGAAARRALIAQGEAVPPYDAVRIAKDGRRIDVSITISPVRDEVGRLVAVSYVMHDISVRKRAEEALRAAEEQFRGLVEQSLTGIYIVQDGKCAYVNSRLAEIFGYASADELIGSDVAPLVAAKDRATVAENIRKRIAGEIKSTSYEFTGLRKDGSAIDVGVHGARATFRDRPAVIGLMQDISEKKRAEAVIRRYIAQLEVAFMSTVKVATTLSEMRDPYTAGHERRVGEIAAAIGEELGLDARRQEGLLVAGHLHDIGKITIPSEILAKPGRLSDIEMQFVRTHAEASYEVLREVDFPWPVARVALEHHERIDGSGYPHGLKGDTILFESRIMAVADVVEAMASHRPYRPGLGITTALAEIERGRGTAYDADVANACLRLFREKGYRLPE